jgi:hypothetical protein
MPGAFPSADDDPPVPVQRAPKKKFIGRKTLEAQGRLKAADGTSLEDTTAVVPSSKSLCLTKWWEQETD